MSRARPSRAAAVTATKQLAKSKTQWAHNESETDSDEYSVEEVSSEEETSDDESIQNLRSGRQRTQEVSISESDSEEELRLRRARKKQTEALKLAKASKTKKKPAIKKKPEMKKKPFKKHKTSAGSKGSPAEDSSTDEDNHDPFDDIDMDRLIQEAMQGSRMSVLHSMCWFRIILDEAHMIKSRSSQTANAAFSLIGIHRWCLSGTPLQNRVGELYSLIRFLRIDPMAHYFCRAKVSNCVVAAPLLDVTFFYAQLTSHGPTPYGSRDVTAKVCTIVC